MSAADLENPPQPDQDLVAGRYRMAGRIGQGRLGDIFHAVDEKRERVGDEQHLALQLVSDVVGRNNSLFNKLRIGYQSLQAAGHPNIVRYRNLDRDGSDVYLVMELLDGAPLSVVLEDAGTVPLDEVRPVLRGVGDALQFLHADGLVHGNLTARNVFITDKLDTRLLDVVPLDATNGIFRGATTSNSGGRPPVADDVFALACLAYQLLAGRHPFNHSNPASSGGREPERIAGLNDQEWNALRRALMPGGEHASYAVADFLRDFGVRGTEHLRAVAESPVANAAPTPKPAATRPPKTNQETSTIKVMKPQFPDQWPDLEEDDPEATPWRAVLLTALLASLGAWYFLGQPEEHVVDLIAYLDSSTSSEVTEQVDVVAAQPEVEQLEMLEPLIEDDVVAFDPEPVAEPETVETELVGPPAEQVAETTVEPVAEPAAEESAAEEPQVGFTESVVVVSEQAGLVQVRLWREAEFDSPLVWWTSDHTAGANSDFVPVPEQFVDVAYGGELRIPLVNDDLPEQRESFYVDVGVWQPQGQIERIASVRVDILDDDLR